MKAFKGFQLRKGMWGSDHTGVEEGTQIKGHWDARLRHAYARGFTFRYWLLLWWFSKRVRSHLPFFSQRTWRTIIKEPRPSDLVLDFWFGPYILIPAARGFQCFIAWPTVFVYTFIGILTTHATSHSCKIGWWVAHVESLLFFLCRGASGI